MQTFLIEIPEEQDPNIIRALLGQFKGIKIKVWDVKLQSKRKAIQNLKKLQKELSMKNINLTDEEIIKEVEIVRNKRFLEGHHAVSD